MATTTGGSTYVVSTDLVANYPTASLALANRVDVVASGSLTKQTASYTVTVADILAGKTIVMNSASATVITLPSASLVNGMRVNAISVNTGAVTFTGGTVTGTVTSISAQYTGVSLTYDSAAAVWWCLPFGGSARATVTGTTGAPTTSPNGSRTAYRWTGTGTVTLTAGLMDVLLVGGGGGGGGDGSIQVGGSAGGYVYVTDVFVPAGTYTLTVGSGGAGGSGGVFGYGSRGTDTRFPNVGLYAIGGGAGVGTSGPSAQSGGGSCCAGGFNIPGQGTKGTGGQGGGSASSTGTGTSNSITGSAVTYAAGANNSSGGAGTNGTGNGGQGAATSFIGGSGIAILLIG